MPRAHKSLEAARHRIWVCTGTACRGRGSQALVRQLRRRSRDGATMVLATGCVRFCSRAPNVVVYPEGVWYSGVTRNVAELLMAENAIANPELEAFVSFRNKTPLEED